MIPVISAILKVIALLVLLVLGYLAIDSFIATIHSWAGGDPGQYGMPSPAVTSAAKRLQSLISPFINLVLAVGIPALLWAFSDITSALREIELNTRASAGLPGPEVEESNEQVTPAPPAE